MIRAGVLWHCFFQAVLRTIGFIHMIQKWLCDNKFMSWVNLCCFTFCLQVCWVLYFLMMQSKICSREEFNRCKIYRMDKICLQVGTFGEFATAVLQTLTVCGNLRDGYHHVNKTNGGWYSLKKNHLKGHLGSIVESKNFWFNNDRQMTGKVQSKVLGGKHRPIKWKLWINGRLMKQAKETMWKQVREEKHLENH